MKSRFWLFAALGVLLGTSAGVAWATTNWMGSEAPLPPTLRTEADKQRMKTPEDAIGGGPRSNEPSRVQSRLELVTPVPQVQQVQLRSVASRSLPSVALVRARTTRGHRKATSLAADEMSQKPARTTPTVRSTPTQRSRTAAANRASAVRDNSHVAAQAARDISHRAADSVQSNPR